MTAKRVLNSSHVQRLQTAVTGPAGLEFLLLGPLEVRRDGIRLELGPPKQRAVLALLLLHGNRVVPTASLIDGLWGDSPPETVRAALQVYVAGLRKALGDGQGTLSTKAPGYKLTLAPGALDLDRFEQFRDEARACGDPERRSALLREALALWRDAPLSEFGGEPFAAIAAEQLEERRLAALEERIDADLAVGRHAEVVPDLDALVLEQPYRERFRGQLMVALYRSGRRDALAAYRDTRRAFASGLGLEPGPELKGLERAVLEQDPALDAPRPEPSSTPPSPDRRGRGRSYLLGLAGLVAAAVIAVAVAIAFTGDDAPRVVVPPNSVAVIDPTTNHVVAVIQVGIRPGPITGGRGTLWVGNLDDRNLTRIDTRSRRPAGTVSLEGRTPTGSVRPEHGVGRARPAREREPRGRPVRDGRVRDVRDREGELLVRREHRGWRRGGLGGVRRRDSRRARSRDGRRGEKTVADGAPVGVAVGYGSVWLASAFQSTVQRFSPLSLAEIDSVSVGTRPSSIAAGFGDVWVTSGGTDSCSGSTSAGGRSGRRSPSATARARWRSARMRSGSRTGRRERSRASIRRRTRSWRRSRSVRRRQGSSSREPPLGDRAGALRRYFRQTAARSSAGRRTMQRGSTRDETNVTSLSTSIAANGASTRASRVSMSPYARSRARVRHARRPAQVGVDADRGEAADVRSADEVRVQRVQGREGVRDRRPPEDERDVPRLAGAGELTGVCSRRDVLGNGLHLDVESDLRQLRRTAIAVAIGGGKSVVYITALPLRVFPRASSFARARSGPSSG